MTPEQLHRAGLTALRRELGVVGMIQFLQQCEPVKGDYTADRWQWLNEDEDIDEIAAAAAKLEAEKLKVE